MSINPPQTHILTRRTFLRAAGAGATLLSGGALFLQGCAQLAQVGQPSAASAPDPVQPATVVPTVKIALTVRKGTTQILPGAPTETWSYHGEVIQGDAAAVQNIPDSYLGPIVRVRRGQRVRVQMNNELDEETM
jgi:blue copper oxidase